MQSFTFSRRGAAPPNLPGVFWPRRTAVLFLVLVQPASANDAVVARFESKAGELDLTADDFADAAAVVGEEGAGLGFVLAQKSAGALGDLTERSVGQTLSFYVCGDLLVGAVVRDRISGRGQVALESLGAANHYARVLNGENSC